MKTTRALAVGLVWGTTFALVGGACWRAAAAEPVIVVRADQPGAAPMRVGVFFEDINYGADGGLYPERVRNRSFEFADPLTAWLPLEGTLPAQFEVRTEEPLHENNPHYLRLRGDGEEAGPGLSNDGFFGVAVEEGAVFRFSVYGRSADARPPALAVAVVGADGGVLASATVRGFKPEWRRQEATLRVKATEAKARLTVQLTGAGTLDVDMVSLFPRATWRQRPNGLRPDLVQWLADLKPAFVRFPGGCIVEGRNLGLRYQWKTTIGDLTERTLIVNRWNDEFRHRPAPDYFQSFGLGFFEYFQLCEDIGAEPLPILNCGMACQFNTGELAPLDQLDGYIQDALDLIEFANGPVTTRWGARRAEMGHAGPFGLRMLGIGNEQWGPQYIERYARFHRVLKERHPEVALVSSAGPQPADDRFKFLWPKLRELGADIVDEHCYDRPAWFLDHGFRYDRYPVEGPKVFMGEYAAQSDKVVSVLNRNNWECALAEAAFLTGLERNSAVVTLSSYAPLFGHETGWQWRPNLIWMDNLRSYGTPSYYVQQLFSVHRGDAVVPVTVRRQAGPSAQEPGLYASGSRTRAGDRVILKVVNSAAAATAARVMIEGIREVRPGGQVVVLSGALKDENSLAQPKRVAPRGERHGGGGSILSHTFPAHSLTVLSLPVRTP